MPPTLRERPAPPRPGGRGCDPCANGELRCHCGSLVARLVDGAVELKCRRCKRTFVLPLSAAESRASP